MMIYGKFLQDSQDVVLDFPFKDSVLTASMTKDDENGYDDAFLNEVIEKDEIDQLFDDKAFQKVKRYDPNGECKANRLLPLIIKLSLSISKAVFTFSPLGS